MEISQLDKAQKIYEQVKQLTTEIINLNKVAELVSIKATKIALSLKIQDLEKEPEKKAVLDQDGSLAIGDQSKGQIAFSLLFGGAATSEKERVQYDFKVKEDLSDTIALEVIGVLIRNKSEARDLGLKQLRKLGVDI